MDLRFVELKDGNRMLAVRLGGRDAQERALLSQSTYGRSVHMQRSYIILIDVEDPRAHWDHREWCNRDTAEAHASLFDVWDNLPRVVDPGGAKIFEIIHTGGHRSLVIAIHVGMLYMVIPLESLAVYVAGKVGSGAGIYHALLECFPVRWGALKSGQILDISSLLWGEGQ